MLASLKFGLRSFDLNRTHYKMNMQVVRVDISRHQNAILAIACYVGQAFEYPIGHLGDSAYYKAVSFALAFDTGLFLICHC